MPTDLPRIGLGTWKLTGNEGIETVRTALDVGYRHIDTAQMYENEAAVGEAIATSAVSREDVLVATKINHRNMPAGTYDEAIQATEESRERLGLDTIDLLYVHWPVGDYAPDETLAAFEELHDRGVIDHVGVCNCTLDLVQEATEYLDIPLLAHQVEMHPLLQQDELLSFAQEDDHWLVAYAPFSHGEVFDNETVQAVAADLDMSPARMVLAWLLSKDNVATVPKASSRAHLKDNLQARSTELPQDAIDRLDAIDVEARYFDADAAPWNN